MAFGKFRPQGKSANKGIGNQGEVSLFGAAGHVEVQAKVVDEGG